jgi:hypothetical protein
LAPRSSSAQSWELADAVRLRRLGDDPVWATRRSMTLCRSIFLAGDLPQPPSSECASSQNATDGTLRKLEFLRVSGGLQGHQMSDPYHSHVRLFQMQASELVACEQALVFELFRAEQEARSLKRRLIIL